MAEARARWQKSGGILRAGIATFLGAPALEEVNEKELRARNVKAAVFGIPFDGGTVSRTGASMGPSAIRKISCHFVPYHSDYDVDIASKLNLHDCGDSFIAVGDVKSTVENGASVASEILKAQAIPIILGGEHTVAIAGTMAIDRTLKGKYGFIMFDAHLDCGPVAGDEVKWFQGVPVARTVEFEAFPGENMVIIGQRGFNPKHWFNFVEEHGINYFSMRQILSMGLESVVDQALEIATRGTDGFYLSIDMDVLEAAYVPGTSAPTPFGITARELWSILPKLGSNDKLKAFDVVEIAPQYDPGEITATTAAAIVVELLAAKASTI